jgi:hypothetical protein
MEAARRARGKIRRYCAANGLNRLGTLTYAGAGNFDQVVLREHLGDFFRSLRASLGGRPLPYLWVPEWHQSHGLHAHFAVGRYVNRTLIADAWGRGHVHIKLLGDLPVGTTTHGEARAAARYLAKYAGKDFDTDRIPGLHRYEVAQGFEPAVTKLHALDLRSAKEEATALMGRPPSYEWQPQCSDGWQGPPAVWMSWD